MAITGDDIIAIAKDAGIDAAVVDGLKFNVPLLTQGLDSIDLPIVAVAVEKKYGIDLSNADPAKLRTIDDFVSYVNQELE